MTDLLERGFDAQARAMRDFGYPDVTADHIRAAHTAWRKGEPPADIIAMFSVKEFDERPEIFGRKDEA